MFFLIPQAPGALIISLRRRALAPLAWLRAIRRIVRLRTWTCDARSRRPVCFAARPLSWPTPCRLPGAKLIISLDGGRELRSLAYAPCGAARGRVLRTMVRWRAGARRASIASCKTKPDRPRQPRRSGAPPIARLPPTLREAVDAAIADGATIDEITARIRAEGGACSRSAVGRYVKNLRDLIRQQQEADRANEMWVRALGERAEGRAGLILIETLRTLTLSALADLSRREEPVSTAELARLALVLRRIEGTDKLRLEREQAAAKAAKAAPGAGQAPVRKGLSPEAVAAIREVVEGRPRPACARRHIGAGRPLESCGLPLIPVNPT